MRAGEGGAMERGGRGENFGGMRRGACWRDRRRRAALHPGRLGKVKRLSSVGEPFPGGGAATCSACGPAA